MSPLFLYLRRVLYAPVLHLCTSSVERSTGHLSQPGSSVTRNLFNRALTARRYYPPFAPRWMRLQEVTLPVEDVLGVD